MAKKLTGGRPRGSTRTDDEVAKAFGGTIAALRVEREISQLDLAGLSNIERSHLGRIERGEATPTLVAACKIAVALDCSVSQLMVGLDVLVAQRRSTLPQ